MLKETIQNIEFFRVRNDINGNPRYVFHYRDLSNSYKKAKILAKSIGGKVYRGHDFEGGIVIQSYNLNHTVKNIISARRFNHETN